MTTTCPACHGPMTCETLDGHLAMPVTIDICPACQVFWFDDREHLQLTPASTLRLFRVIGEGARRARPALPPVCRCPRCDMRLAPVHDRQRATRFEYLRCPARHGRLISFFDFLREKNFITPLSPDQVEILKQNVQFLNCSNCGAPMDLSQASTCAHCGSPLSMIDLKQAATLIDHLTRTAPHGAPDVPGAPPASTGSGPGGPLVDPALPLRLLQARREVESSFAAWQQDADWLQDVSSAGLLGASLSALFRPR